MTQTTALSFRTACAVALLLGGLSLLAAPDLSWAEEEAEAGAEELPLTFRAQAMNPNRGGTARFDIRLQRWTTGEERDTLLAALQEDDTLARTMGGLDRVGTLRPIRSTAENLRYSRDVPTEDGGRMIILATDRPMAFVEAWGLTRTRRNDITVIQMTLDAEGSGEGVMMIGANVSWNEETDSIEVEHFSSQPIRLTSIELQ